MPDGGGWRYVGRAQGKRNKTAAAHRTGQRNQTYRHPLSGTAFIPTVLDDHSRVAYSEIRDDETRETAVSVLRNAAAWFAARGVRIERVLSDNGSCYRSKLWTAACAELGITPKKTRPYRLTPDQWQGRALPPHPGRRMGLQEVLLQRLSPPRRIPGLAPRI